MDDLEQILSGRDLRSLGRSNSLIASVQNQADFDSLFNFLFHPNRIIVMRAADIIEKITIGLPEFLETHKAQVLEISHKAENKELIWHLALMIPRLPLDQQEQHLAWDRLSGWAKDNTNSRIVRVNSVQGLFELLKHDRGRQADFDQLLDGLRKDNIPSLNARIKKLENLGPE